MPVFEAKHVDNEFEGQALLGAILHPTQAARLRALRLGRHRAERSPFQVEPLDAEPRFPMTGEDLAPVAAPHP